MKLHAGRSTRIDDLVCGLVCGRSTEPTVVMAGLDPAIHEAGQQVKSYLGNARLLIMDCRVKPGNDEREVAGCVGDVSEPWERRQPPPAKRTSLQVRSVPKPISHSVYSITSSASATSIGGSSSPMALAVLMLMTNG